MAEFDNTNRGSLFKNDKKSQDTHADYNGSVNVEGVEYWLNAWIKESKSGSKFMSLSLKPKDAQQAPKQAAKKEELESDLPF
jgi:uncharacterized protein (DUF736 family)